MAFAIKHNAQYIPNKVSLAIMSFFWSLLQIPAIICNNAGIDSAEILRMLRAYHKIGYERYGFDVVFSVFGDMKILGIYESFSVKHQILKAATEAVNCIIRVNKIVVNKPKSRLL